MFLLKYNNRIGVSTIGTLPSLLSSLVVWTLQLSSAIERHPKFRAGFVLSRFKRQLHKHKLQSNPKPIQSKPIQTNPNQSNPIQTNPTQSNQINQSINPILSINQSNRFNQSIKQSNPHTSPENHTLINPGPGPTGAEQQR